MQQRTSPPRRRWPPRVDDLERIGLIGGKGGQSGAFSEETAMGREALATEKVRSLRPTDVGQKGTKRAAVSPERMGGRRGRSVRKDPSSKGGPLQKAGGAT